MNTGTGMNTAPVAETQDNTRDRRSHSSSSTKVPPAVQHLQNASPTCVQQRMFGSESRCFLYLATHIYTTRLA